jgi:hypothetical protein
MKKGFLSIIALLTVLIFATPAHAGFVTKKATSVTSIISPAPAHNNAGSSRQEIRNARLQKLSAILNHEDHDHEHEHHRHDSGWEGTAAMWCGIGGIFFLPAFLCAVVFGVMGMGKGRRHRGRAIAGLVIGIVAINLLLLLIALG